MIELNPLIEALACCTKTDLDETAKARLLHLAQSGLDWNRVADLARAHGVLPLLHLHLRQVCGDAIEQAVLQRVRAEAYTIATFNHYLSRELLAIVTRLNAGGIEVLPLKGPVLGEFVYGSVTRRQFVDLDFLVRPEDFLAAARLLEADGYQASPERSASVQASGFWRLRYHQPFFHPDRRILVELHQALVEPYFCRVLTADAIWPRVQRLSFMSGEVLWLKPDDQLIYLCIHASKHAWNRLGWIGDISELLRSAPDLNWDCVLHHVRHEPTRYMVLTGLGLASELFDAPIAGPVRDLMLNDRKVGRLVAIVLRSLNESVEQPRDPKAGWVWDDSDAREIHFQFLIQSTVPGKLWFCWWLMLEKLVVAWAMRPLPWQIDGLFRYADSRYRSVWGLWIASRALLAVTYYLTLPAAKWIRAQFRGAAPEQNQ